MIVSVDPVIITLPAPAVARSQGVHVSNIIRCIATETGILRPEWCEELALIEVGPSRRFDDPVVALRISIGLAWEEWYIPRILGPEGVIDHPGEYQVDGIYMTPDGEELSQVIIDGRRKSRIVMHEVKATYKSLNTVGETVETLQTQFMWLAQIKAYCKAAGTRFADLHVLFVCGDYSYPIRPMARRYRLEFEQWEIDENWGLLTAYRDQRLRIELGE